MDSSKPNFAFKVALIAGSASLVFSLLVGLFFGRVVSPLVQQPSKHLEADLVAAAADYNKKAPILVDDVTRLDSCSAGPGPVFQYNYTIMVNRTPDEFYQMLFLLRPKVREHAFKDLDMNFFRVNKVQLVYNYRDLSGQSIGQIVVLPSEY